MLSCHCACVHAFLLLHCLCVCFRTRCVFHSCSCTECVHFNGLFQQFTSHHADLSASSWASKSTNSYPAGLTDYSCRVSTDTHTVKRGDTPQRISVFIISYEGQKKKIIFLFFFFISYVVSVKYRVPGWVRQSH